MTGPARSGRAGRWIRLALSPPVLARALIYAGAGGGALTALPLLTAGGEGGVPALRTILTFVVAFLLAAAALAHGMLGNAPARRRPRMTSERRTADDA